MLSRIMRVLLEKAGGDGAAGGGGAGGAGGAGAGGGQGGGSIMSSGAGAGGGTGGAAGGGGAGGAGAGGQGGGAGAGGAGGAGGSGAGGGTAEWFYADGVKGTGAKPEWLDARYKTVDEQAKAYVEAAKKIGPAAELIGAPEGDYALPEVTLGAGGKWEWDAKDPMLVAFSKAAKEAGLSQKAFEKLAAPVARALAEADIAEEQSLADALASLGNNVAQRVTAVGQFLTAKLGADGFAALDGAVGKDAKAFAQLERLVALAAGDARLSDLPGSGGAGFSRAEIEAEQYKVFPEGHPLAGKRMYEHDKAHREKVDGMWKKLYPGEDRTQVG